MIELDGIVNSPPQFGPALSTLAGGVTSGALAVFFGGGIADVMTSTGIGLLLGLLAQFVARSTDQARVLELVSAGLRRARRQCRRDPLAVGDAVARDRRVAR